MRHRKRGRRLGRNPAHRAALRRNLLRNFVRHGVLTTTLTKAKEIRPHVEKLLSLGRTRSLARIRRALTILGHDRELVARLFGEIGPQCADRPGGYTRLLKLAKPRLGDAAPRARLELVTEELAGRPTPQPRVEKEEPEAEEEEGPVGKPEAAREAQEAEADSEEATAEQEKAGGDDDE